MRRMIGNKVLLAILCIAIGMVPLLTLVNTVGSGKAMLDKGLGLDGKKLISIKFYGPNVTYSDLKSLEEGMPEIKTIIPIAKIVTSLNSYKSSSAVELKAVGSDYWKLSGLDLTKGSFFGKIQTDAAQNVIVIDDMTADKLFGTTDVLGRIIKITLNGSDVEAVIVGVCKKIDLSNAEFGSKQGMAFVPITFLDSSSDSYSIDEVLLLTSLHVEEAKSRIIHYFEGIGADESQLDISYVNQTSMISSFLDKYQKTFWIFGLLWFLAVAAALTSIIFADIERQKKYYGLLRFYGNTEKQIKRTVLSHSITMGLTASIFSILFGLMSSFIICMILNIPIYISVHTLTLGILLPVAVCLVAAYYPAMRASRIDMHKVIWQFD